MRRDVMTLSLVAAVCGGAWFLYGLIPASLVPNEDQGTITCLGILDEGASLNRTMETSDFITEFALADPAIRSVTKVSGLDVTSASVKSNRATFFLTLAPWARREREDESSDALVKKWLPQARASRRRQF